MVNIIITEKQPDRNGAVDLFRCFGIVLMIMGHIGFGDLFDKYIHAFHMPMWFVITGMFCKPDANTIPYIKKKAFKLLVPYFAFGIIYELVHTMLRGGISGMEYCGLILYRFLLQGHSGSYRHCFSLV